MSRKIPRMARQMKGAVLLARFAVGTYLAFLRNMLETLRKGEEEGKGAANE